MISECLQLRLCLRSFLTKSLHSPDLLSLDSIIMDPAYIPVLNDSLILWESGSGKRMCLLHDSRNDSYLTAIYLKVAQTDSPSSPSEKPFKICLIP
jgi:hypothetical protein